MPKPRSRQDTHAPRNTVLLFRIQPYGGFGLRYLHAWKLKDAFLPLSLSSISATRFLPRPAPGEIAGIGGTNPPGLGTNGMSL